MIMCFVGENVGKKTSAHFMLNGTCKMLQKLVLRKKADKYELDRNQQSDSKAGNEVQCVYMQLCLFTKGGCFGLGMSMLSVTQICSLNFCIKTLIKYIF